MYIHVSTCILAVTCTPACQNGGTCHRSSSNAYCDCPSGYTGDYCQNEGIYAHAIRSIPLQASLTLYIHTYIHCDSHHFAVTCTPACQNGGTCRGNSSYTYCDCPKNYTGPHCENRGTATHNQRAGGPGNMQMAVSYLLLILLHICSRSVRPISTK